MRFTILTSLVLAALATPAQAAVSDFRLPAEPQQPPPDRQGPVAPDVPASRRPAPSPTPAPTPVPTAAAPAPEVTPPVFVPPVALPPADSEPTRRAGQAVEPRPAPQADTRTASPIAPEPVEPAGLAPPAMTEAATPAPSPSPAEPGDDPAGGGGAWTWLLAALATLAALGAAGWAWRRRTAARLADAPQIERPRVTPRPAPAPASGPRPEPAPDPAEVSQPRPAPVLPRPAFAEPLQVSLEPLRLSLTLMNATLAYRLQVANTGPAPLTGLTIGADMISAHASLSREEQLAGPDLVSGNGRVAVQRIDRLAPGESRVVDGEFRLPFQQIVPIRQGNAALLLPLARFRLEAEGARPVVRTFLVGQPGKSERLQPFRLDLGPRIYPNLAQHAFA